MSTLNLLDRWKSDFEMHSLSLLRIKPKWPPNIVLVTRINLCICVFLVNSQRDNDFIFFFFFNPNK